MYTTADLISIVGTSDFVLGSVDKFPTTILGTSEPSKP